MSTTKPVASLTMVNLDCRDPRALAAFYAGILGWEVTYSEEEYAMISGTGTSRQASMDRAIASAWPRASASMPG